MKPEGFTPDNTTVVLIDYAVGFVNNVRSHDTADHLNSVVGLAKPPSGTRAGSLSPIEPSHSAGPLYPELLDVLGDREVIQRPPSARARLMLEHADHARGRPGLTPRHRPRTADGHRTPRMTGPDWCLPSRSNLDLNQQTRNSPQEPGTSNRELSMSKFSAAAANGDRGRPKNMGAGLAAN